MDGEVRHDDGEEKEGVSSRTTGGRQSSLPSTSRATASRTKLSMPDSVEIARMREEYLSNAPAYPCFPKRLQPLRVELYLLLEEPTSSTAARVLSIVIFACIILSITLFIAETLPELKFVPEGFWIASECFFTIVFLMEYIVRLLVFDVTGVPIWTFIRTPMNIVDVVAVLPFFVIVVLQSCQAIGFIRAVRLVRLFRIFKLGRYSTGLKMMMVALGNSGQALSVLVFFLGIGCVLFSSVVYHLEKLSCPDRARLDQAQLDTYAQECKDKRESQFGLCCTEYDAPLDFPSILSTFWWSIVTMTTVGYGDVVPRTNVGKFAGAMTMCSGILLLALPIALIGARFQEAYNMAVSSRGSPGLQVRRKAKDRDEPPTKAVSTRLRLLLFSNATMTRLTRELAKELDEASALQEDVRMFEKAERQSQRQVLESGIALVARLQHFSDQALMVRKMKSDSRPTPPEESQSSAVAPGQADSRLVLGTADRGGDAAGFTKSVTFRPADSVHDVEPVT